eukprot:160616_1
MAKLLRETVEVFGQSVTNSKIKTFYHGISTLIFSEFIANFCTPTSTTSSIVIAANFATVNDNDSKGMILSLTDYNNNHVPYFNCSFISKFGHEKEMLFFGGWAPLKLSNISLIENNINLKYWIKSLFQYDIILKGGKPPKFNNQFYKQIITDLYPGFFNDTEIKKFYDYHRYKVYDKNEKETATDKKNKKLYGNKRDFTLKIAEKYNFPKVNVGYTSDPNKLALGTVKELFSSRLELLITNELECN